MRDRNDIETQLLTLPLSAFHLNIPALSTHQMKQPLGFRCMLPHQREGKRGREGGKEHHGKQPASIACYNWNIRFFFCWMTRLMLQMRYKKSYNVTSLSFQSKEIRQITITSHFKIVTTCHSTVTGLDRIWLIINM